MRRILIHTTALFIASSLFADHHEKKPAFDVLGSWHMTATLPSGEERTLTLKFDKKGDKITGTSISHSSERQSELENISVSGHEVKYEVPFNRDGQQGTIRVELKHADHQLKGVWIALDADDVEAARGELKGDLTIPHALLGNWDMLVDLTEAEIDYTLKISEVEGKLKGIIVSPRSGERTLKSVAFKNGKLVMSETRDYQGEELRSKFTASLKDGKLTGTVEFDGAPGVLSGDWNASKKK